MTTIGSVEDYDGLRGLSSGSYEVLLVRQQKASVPLSSYIHPNGGIFVWDKNAAEGDDGISIISPVPSPLKGRWKHLFDDVLSVKWFGAMGDLKEYYEDDKGFKYHFKGTIDNGKNTLTLTHRMQPVSLILIARKTIVIWTTGQIRRPEKTRTFHSLLRSERVLLIQ